MIRNRVLEVRRFYAALLPGREVEQIFVSETVNEDGQRILENLSFFFGNVWCEAHNFQTEDNFDLARIGQVSRFVLKRDEYTTGEATTRSRLSVNVFFEGDIAGVLKASSENCDTLWLIVQRYFLPSTTD
ncbi:MAG: hypothetical protein Q8K86_01385 [Candidatus Nanopelagicaceae bacterium]|nr:hypothetical protein [Candidatus Nanopelagicaceae bacterium]